MLAAVQPAEQLLDHRLMLADREVAEMPEFIIRPNRCVPALDDRFILNPALGGLR